MVRFVGLDRPTLTFLSPVGRVSHIDDTKIMMVSLSLPLPLGNGSLPTRLSLLA